MNWVTLITALLTLILKIWDAIHEHNKEKKKAKTEALQSGVRAVIDRDASRLNAAISDFNRML